MCISLICTYVMCICIYAVACLNHHLTSSWSLPPAQPPFPAFGPEISSQRIKLHHTTSAIPEGGSPASPLRARKAFPGTVHKPLSCLSDQRWVRSPPPTTLWKGPVLALTGWDPEPSINFAYSE